MRLVNIIWGKVGGAIQNIRNPPEILIHPSILMNLLMDIVTMVRGGTFWVDTMSASIVYMENFRSIYNYSTVKPLIKILHSKFHRMKLVFHYECTKL